MQILIAEDDADVARLYRAALESRGHKVTLTYDGLQCLNAYRQAMRQGGARGKKPSMHDPYDVVILDFKMPKADGLEIAREIIALNPQQRSIFVSAFVRDTIANSMRDLKQVVEVIQKPFEPEQLADLVDDMSAAEKLQELKANAKEMNATKQQPDESDVDMLLKQLRNIQKSRTI